MKVKELMEKLEDMPDDYEVMVDPPFYPVRSVYINESEEAVELKH